MNHFSAGFNVFSATPLSEDQIAKRAPSVFASGPKKTVSDRYCFIPTTRLIKSLNDEGWKCYYAIQSSARNQGGLKYAKHLLRFRHPDLMKMFKSGGEIPELIITNSHNATSSFVMASGILRLVCTNGLVAGENVVESYRIRHTGYRDEDVKVAAQAVMDNMPKLKQKVERLSSVKLTDGERFQFAQDARILKWDEKKAPVEAADLLTSRRDEDRGTDLWTTFNVVQENLIQGGLRGRATTGRRLTTRPVRGVGGNVRLNRQLWDLAEATADRLG